mgnify:CR=1 FL=1
MSYFFLSVVVGFEFFYTLGFFFLGNLSQKSFSASNGDSKLVEQDFAFLKLRDYSD